MAYLVWISLIPLGDFSGFWMDWTLKGVVRGVGSFFSIYCTLPACASTIART